MNFLDRLKLHLDTVGSHLCIGLDVDYDKIPQEFKRKNVSESIFAFSKVIVEATYDLCIGYKFNLSFYEGYGVNGLQGLNLTTSYIKQKYPDLLLFADSKKAEIGDSAVMFRKQIIDNLGFDCVMITPWFGYDSVRDLELSEDMGVSIYVHDSNKTASEIQDLELKNGKILYEYLTEKILKEWNTQNNLLIEVGATYPNQLRMVREIVGEDYPILTVGIGSQGGKINDLKGIFGKNDRRLIVCVSRRIIYPQMNDPDYPDAVRRSAEDIAQELLKISSVR